jgi:hypothetical protein
LKRTLALSLASALLLAATALAWPAAWSSPGSTPLIGLDKAKLDASLVEQTGSLQLNESETARASATFRFSNGNGLDSSAPMAFAPSVTLSLVNSLSSEDGLLDALASSGALTVLFWLEGEGSWTNGDLPAESPILELGNSLHCVLAPGASALLRVELLLDSDKSRECPRLVLPDVLRHVKVHVSATAYPT